MTNCERILRRHSAFSGLSILIVLAATLSACTDEPKALKDMGVIHQETPEEKAARLRDMADS